jgi:hypothetical protein
MLAWHSDNSTRRHRGHSSYSRKTGLPLAPLCFAFLLGSCASGRVIEVNERIHHDDFEYSVTHFVVTDSIGSGNEQKRASGHFCIVTFEVENRAKRVNHKWDNTIAYIVDDQGRSYENVPELQVSLNRVQPFNYAEQHLTPAGETEATQLVFDLPANISHPYLMVRGELLMGDVFDGKAFARTKVKLF